MKALSEFLRPEFLEPRGRGYRVPPAYAGRTLRRLPRLMLDEYVGFPEREGHIHFVYDDEGHATGWRNMPSAEKAARATCAI